MNRRMLWSLINRQLLRCNELSAAAIFSPSPSEMSSNSDSDGRFSDESEESEEEIVDLNLPTPLPKKKKLISDFFNPTKRLPHSGGMSYCLQRYNLRPTPVSGPSLGQTSSLPSSSKEPSTEASIDRKKKGVGTRSG